MLTINDYPYFQPDRYSDDGINIDYGGMPEELFSFQAFRTEEECRQWLINHDYNPDEFVIHEYCNDDIVDVTIIDEDGSVIPKIEDFSSDEIEDMLTDEVLFAAGSIDNLAQAPHDGETKDQYRDRLYGLAQDEVEAAIRAIEENNEYDFSAYGGNPDTEWYDGVRVEAILKVMNWMLDLDEA